VAVIGVPDDDLGQEVKAVVQLVDGAVADETLAKTLLEHCREQLASYKCPKTVDFWAELPREDNGKLYKRTIIDHYWADRTSRLT
jgi:acyl-coenzyme A synthetase/AMP-(fatty) acid ligase